MNDSEWRRRYEAALRRARERAETAQRAGRRTACAFTSNVDRVAILDEALLERLFAGRSFPAGAPRVRQADTVDELLLGIAQCIAAGDGIDLPVPEAVQAWLLARMGGREQIGGTGAQAAATLATLGFPVLLHLTGYSPQQIAVLPHRERIALGSPDGLIPLDATADSDDATATMWHPVLEFPAGLPAPLSGRPVSPVANRILIHHDPINADFRIDPGFDAALTDPALSIGALLISGFSQLADREALERVLWDTAVAVQIWRAAHDDLVVHLELGAMPDPSALLRILEVVHPVVTSVGLNVDELGQIAGARGEALAAAGPELVAQLRRLAARYPVPRVSLHTREFCATVTSGDPESERDALLFGSLVAATRARTGAFPTFADLEATLREGGIDAAGLAMLTALDATDDGRVGEGVVVTPGYRNERTVATVGLGDSFTGGVLAMAG